MKPFQFLKVNELLGKKELVRPCNKRDFNIIRFIGRSGGRNL